MSVKIKNETYTTLEDILSDESKVSPAERAQIEFETALIGKSIENKTENNKQKKNTDQFPCFFVLRELQNSIILSSSSSFAFRISIF